MAKAIMIQGTGSDVGKTILTLALYCSWVSQGISSKYVIAYLKMEWRKE